MQPEGSRTDKPPGPTGGAGRARWVLAAVVVAGATLAWLALAGGAQGYHSNPTCAGGSYTQTWNADVTVISPQPPIVDECILVQANVSVQSGGELRFRDSRVVFDNDLGNFTLYVNGSALLEFRDDDGSIATSDGSWLGVLNDTVTWTGFFFASDPGARVYFNDTEIHGGGLPGVGLSSATAFSVDAPDDFSWVRVTHVTASSGLFLSNYTRGLTIPDYDVSGNPVVSFAYGLALYRCANVTVTGLTTGPLGITGLYAEESSSITVRNATAKTAVTGFRFLLTDRVLIEDTSSQRHLDIGFVLDHVAVGALNRVTAVPAQVAHFGILVVSSTGLEMAGITLGKHDTADLDISGTTRWVNMTNAMISQTRAGSGVRVTGTGAADDAADITFRNLTVSQKGPSGGYAVWLRSANRVLFDVYNITGAAGMGVGLETSSSVRFSNGIIWLNAEGAGFTSSGNVSFAYSRLVNNAGGGLVVGGGSFTLDNVEMRSSAGWSVHSAPSTLMTGVSTIRDSTLEGLAGKVVEISLVTGSTAQLQVLDTQFVRLQNAPQFFLALDLTGFQTVAVADSMFSSFGVRVARTGDVQVRDCQMDIVLLPSTTTLLRFEEVGSLLLEGVSYVNVPIDGKLFQVVNVTRLFGSATLRGMAFPRADFGAFVMGEGGSFSPSLVLTDVTMPALVEGVKGWQLLDASIDRLTTYSSTRAVVFDLKTSATGATYSVANSTLQASAAGITSTSDTQAVVRVTNVAFDRTNSTPTVGLSVVTAHDVYISGLRVDGLPTGIDIRSARFVWVDDMDFRDNTWGLRMTADQNERTDINWTVDRPTVISNTHLMIRGQVWVQSTQFAITAGSIVEIFSKSPADTISQFHLEGSSHLVVNGSSRVAGWEGSIQAGTFTARYTMELSPQATVALENATFDRLGRTGSAPPVQRGFFFQAADTTVRGVRFVNTTAALRASGVNLTVIACAFTGRDGTGLSMDVSNATLTVLGGTTVYEGPDGVRVVNGQADISNSSFESIGAALTADGSRANFVDSRITFASFVIDAENASNVVACRLSIDHSPNIFLVRGGSTLRLCDSSSMFPTTDGNADGGSNVDFDNVFVDRVSNRGTDNQAMAYSVLTPGSDFRAWWLVTVRVTSCPLGSDLPIGGADVSIYNRIGDLVIPLTTGADGRTPAYRLLYFASQDNVETVNAPFTFTASKGVLSTTVKHPANQTADIELCLDDQPPELRLSVPVGCPSPMCVLPATQNGTISIRGSTWDNISGLEQGYPCLSVDGGTCTPIPPSFDLQKPLHEGLNTFAIFSRDRFGNEANVTIRVVRDTTPPVFVSCSPPKSHKTAAGAVDLECQMAGDPLDPPTISGVRSSDESIDASQVLRAHIMLDAGGNTFQVTVTDALGNTNSSSFSWVLDNIPPAPTLTSGYNETVTRLFGVRLRGTLPSDTESVTFGGSDVPLGSSTLNAEWENLTEGRNERTLRITDDVGNVWEATLWIEVDTMTNCTLLAPSDGERKVSDTVSVGGSCDPDVTVRISGLVGALTPDPDGRWSGQVQLHQGENLIVVTATDSHGVPWEEQVTVFFAPPTDGGIPFAFILLLILAAGVFAAAITLMRRPRRPTPEEPPRPLTGSHKAPPRARPPPLRLPELPDDETFRPPAPPLPPPRYPPRQPPRP